MYKSLRGFILLARDRAESEYIAMSNRKEFKPSGNSRYAKRYQKRVELAKECDGGFYINTKGRKVPLAMPVLKSMS
jgi:hypothetical protein